ncbi:MAG: hypothetical protein FJ134_00905 [Deltaproteobacteria bacterium]|nr:hypothetical protein [Deltaproteobacteria bacterium]
MFNRDKGIITNQAIYNWLRRFAWPIIIISVLTAAWSVVYTVNNLAMHTSRSELVASDLSLIRQSEAIDREFGSRDNFVVVVENSRPQATAFAEDLARELRKHPREFPEIFYRVDPEPLKHWALLYMEPADLSKLKASLQEHRRELDALAADPSLTRFFQVVSEEITRALIKEVFTSFLEEKKEEELPDLGLLNSTLKELYLYIQEGRPYHSPLKSLFPGEISDLSQEGYFYTENNKYLLFLVTTAKDGYLTSTRELQLLRELVSRAKARYPDLKVGVTGPEALEDDEMDRAMADINLASWVSLFGQMLIMVLFFRSIKRTLVQGIVLVIGLCWTFGLATLMVGHLNLLSIVFGPLMLGIAVDFGIHWYCRLEEEEGESPRCTAVNFSRTVKGATPGVLYAALAAAVSVAPLIFTGFKGLAELGLIITLGIIFHIFASLVLLPALAVVTERCHLEAAATQEEKAPQPQPFLSLHWQRPGALVVLGLVVTALGVVSLMRVPFDLNPLHLQNQNTESVVWELKLIRDSFYSTTYGTMIASRLEDLPEKTEALKKLDTVSNVESILSFLPSHLAAKQQAIEELRPIVAGVNFPLQPVLSNPQELAIILGRLRYKVSQALEEEWEDGKSTKKQLTEAHAGLSQLIPLLDPQSHPTAASRLSGFEQKFFADLKDKWDLIQKNLKNAGNPPQVEDLPEDVRVRFISPNGFYLIRVFPSKNIWDTENLAKFVENLRQVDPSVVGDPVLLYVFTLAFRYACLWAAGVALLGITLMLWLLLRSLKLTLLSLVPLLVGTSLTLSLMWLLDIPFNQANVLFLPLILGEGIEYGIIIIVRWQLEESARAITLPASTAKGVAVAALTTAVGFGSLMLSGHRGTFSLGLLSAVGALSVLLASLSIFPAFLRLLARRTAAPQAEMNPILGLKRWLWQHLRKEAP